MQAGGHLPSSVSAARSATKGRGVEGLADGDEGIGNEGASQGGGIGERAGTRGTAETPVLGRVYHLVPLPPPPPYLMESWGWRDFFALVFESKGLILKYFRNGNYPLSSSILEKP